MDGNTGLPFSVSVGGLRFSSSWRSRPQVLLRRYPRVRSSFALTCCSTLAAAWKDAGLRKLESMATIYAWYVLRPPGAKASACGEAVLPPLSVMSVGSKQLSSVSVWLPPSVKTRWKKVAGVGAV